MRPKFLNRKTKVKSILEHITSVPKRRFQRWYDLCVRVRNAKETPREKKEKILLKLCYQLTAGNCTEYDKERYFDIMRMSTWYLLKVKENGQFTCRTNPIGSPKFKRLRFRSYQGYLKVRDGRWTK